MKKRVNGRIGLGCSSLGTMKGEDAIAIVRRAVDSGINFFDTGASYGKSEKYLGEALLSLRQTDILVASKSLAQTAELIERDVNLSLNQLSLDKITLYQMHGINDLKDLTNRLRNGVLEKLLELQDEGLIDFIGVTSHSDEVVKRVGSLNEITSVMLCYNMGLMQRKRSIVKYLKSKDKFVIVMKPLGGGFLIPPLQYAEQVAAFYPYGKPEILLGAVLSDENVDLAIPGVRFISELDEILSVKEQLPAFSQAEILDMDNDVARIFGDSYCRFCKYCVPCSQNSSAFNMPQILRTLALHEVYGLKDYAKNLYRRLGYSASQCIGCGVCEKRCPFNIPIGSLLMRAAETFEDD